MFCCFTCYSLKMKCIFKPLWMCECVLQRGIFLSQKMWQQEEGCGSYCVVGTPEASLWSVPYCARCSASHWQPSKQLPIRVNTHFDSLGTLSSSQAMEHHSTCLFISSQMQIMESWQRRNFLGCQCRFTKGSYDMVVHHVCRRWLLCLEANEPIVKFEGGACLFLCF